MDIHCYCFFLLTNTYILIKRRFISAINNLINFYSIYKCTFPRMPSFNKEVQGNDFGFFKEEIGGGRHRVGGNHFWHQISCRFSGLEKAATLAPANQCWDLYATTRTGTICMSWHIAKICIWKEIWSRQVGMYAQY